MNHKLFRVSTESPAGDPAVTELSVAALLLYRHNDKVQHILVAQGIVDGDKMVRIYSINPYKTMLGDV